MSKIISPCVGVCKYKLKGRCTGCGMRKGQKKAFKKMETSDDRKAFLVALMSCQKELKVHEGWVDLYQKKYKKRGKQIPLELEIQN